MKLQVNQRCDSSRDTCLQSKEIPTRKGTHTRIRCYALNGLDIVVRGSFLRIAGLWEEDYVDIANPCDLIDQLKALRNRPDLFTFKQRYPQVSPIYPFYRENESIAVLPITTFDAWIDRQISKNSKRLIRKAIQSGIRVRTVNFDATLIEGMRMIFDEAPIRQGKRFWHYKKGQETIKREFSRYLFREHILGAFLGGNLVGFIFLAQAGNYAVPSQILASLAHHEKGITNLLLAEAVRMCAQDGIAAIVYGDWQESGLTEFKRRNGFCRIEIPRYFVPISQTGNLALRLRVHHGLSKFFPPRLRYYFKLFRSRWNKLRLSN